MSQGKIAFPLRVPFVETLGFELWAFGGGRAELRVNLEEAHLNSWDVAHGGVLMTLLDVAMAHAARSPQGGHAELGPGVATIEMKTTFMRAAEGPLRAEGHLLHKTTTLAFCEGSVFDETGALCAHATATFKYLRALPARARQAKELQRAVDDGEPEGRPETA